MQYPKSGVSPTEVLYGSADNLLGASITTGRVLWLRQFWVANDGLSGGGVGGRMVVTLSDCSVDAIGSGALVKRYEVGVTSGDTKLVEFAAPGLKFEAGCVISNDSGFIQRGRCGGWGYEE